MLEAPSEFIRETLRQTFQNPFSIISSAFALQNFLRNPLAQKPVSTQKGEIDRLMRETLSILNYFSCIGKEIATIHVS